MKNLKTLTINFVINQKGAMAVIKSIKCTTLQYAFERNIERIGPEFLNINKKLDELKDPDFKKLEEEVREINAQKKTDAKSTAKVEKHTKLAEAFNQKPEVIELLEFENDLKIYKLPLEKLPPDLDGNQLSLIEWMIEEEN